MIHVVGVSFADSRLDRFPFHRPRVLNPPLVAHRGFHPVVRHQRMACSAASGFPTTESHRSEQRALSRISDRSHSPLILDRTSDRFNDDHLPPCLLTTITPNPRCPRLAELEIDRLAPIAEIGTRSLTAECPRQVVDCHPVHRDDRWIRMFDQRREATPCIK